MAWRNSACRAWMLFIHALALVAFEETLLFCKATRLEESDQGCKVTAASTDAGRSASPLGQAGAHLLKQLREYAEGGSKYSAERASGALSRASNGEIRNVFVGKDAVNEQGETVLHIAAKKGHTSMVAVFLKYAADVGVKQGHSGLLKEFFEATAGKNGPTALDLAIEGGHEAVKMLLEKMNEVLDRHFRYISYFITTLAKEVRDNRRDDKETKVLTFLLNSAIALAEAKTSDFEKNWTPETNARFKRKAAPGRKQSNGGDNELDPSESNHEEEGGGYSQRASQSGGRGGYVRSRSGPASFPGSTSGGRSFGGGSGGGRGSSGRESGGRGSRGPYNRSGGASSRGGGRSSERSQSWDRASRSGYESGGYSRNPSRSGSSSGRNGRSRPG
eukprot:TRINITY_DN22142_c0_g1_i1.p1 TRINITY_DN22142_c0_g1~~TRINITY_DN22142_c0_g1_i1.p1  ORF type:complete len:389 (-),score=36.73 TRINITY_DN22142_c0_g1_i1:129-1295(-)